MAKSTAQRKPPARPSLRGKFITFEGMDGVGKSTQAKLLEQRLAERGFHVLLTREPGGTAIGTSIRSVLLDPRNTGWVAESELLLFLADRIQHIAEVIRPALARGEVVLCDRYHDATVAYQRYGRALDFAPVQRLIQTHIRPTWPDLTFCLDTGFDTADARLFGRASEEATQALQARERASFVPVMNESRLELEQQAFRARVRNGYRAIARKEPGRVQLVDASRDVDTVHQDLWQRLTLKFKA